MSVGYYGAINKLFFIKQSIWKSKKLLNYHSSIFVYNIDEKIFIREHYANPINIYIYYFLLRQLKVALAGVGTRDANCSAVARPSCATQNILRSMSGTYWLCYMLRVCISVNDPHIYWVRCHVGAFVNLQQLDQKLLKKGMSGNILTWQCS